MEVGADIRTKVKSLKIDIAERTRSSESLLLKMTYINIFAENHKKKQRNTFGKCVKADYDIIRSYDVIR